MQRHDLDTGTSADYSLNSVAYVFVEKFSERDKSNAVAKEASRRKRRDV